MDKNLIKEHLRKTFVSEADSPGISVTDKAKKESGKVNKQGLKDYAKVVEKNGKKEEKEMSKNKFNYTDKFQKTYHDEMEIMNGQEMLQYDMNPSDEFKKKAKEGIEGSSKMGNENGVGNAEATWGASSDNFGKDFVKRVKASTEKRSKQTPTLNLRGQNIQADIKDTGHKPYAIEENIFNTPQMGGVTSSKGTAGYINNTSKMDKEYTDSIRKTKPTTDDKKPAKDEEIKENQSKAAVIADKNVLDKKKSDFVPDEDYEKISREVEYGVNPNKDNNKDNKKIKTESMKRLKFKSAFNGLGNALKLIPESYRTDNKVFEMTDGNESYKIRWEGTLNEGKAVVLMASDNKLVNEDINRMKALFGYKSQDTLGLVKGNARINENKAFSDILGKMKQLMNEGEDMMETEAPKPKEGNWEEEKKKAPEATKNISTTKGKPISKAKPTEKNWEETSGGEKMMETEAPKPKEGNPDKVKKQAPEAKENISTAKGQPNSKAKPSEKNWEETSGGEKMMDGVAPTPKEGHWEDNPPSQAPEAKKHVHLKESELMSEYDLDTDDLENTKSNDDAYGKAFDSMGGEDEEETEAPETDSWSKSDDDSSDESEPASTELGGIPTEDDPEDEIVVPKAKGGFTLLSSPSSGRYFIKGPGLPLEGMEVPNELLTIASNKSMKATERASIIAKKLEDMTDEVSFEDDDNEMM